MDRQYKNPQKSRGEVRSLDGFVRSAQRPQKYSYHHRPRPQHIAIAKSPELTDGFEAKPNPEPTSSVTVDTAPPVVSYPDVPQPQEDQTPLPTLDMTLPGTVKKHHKRTSVKHCSWCAFRIWAFRAVVTMLIITFGVGALLLGQGYFKAKEVFRGSAKVAVALKDNVDPNLLKGEGDGRVNMLMLGIGGGNHEAPDLTDTIIVASIDPINKKADLLSIPRDMWVNVPGYGNMKLNAVYETGKYAYLHKIDSSNANSQAVDAGFAMTDRMVEKILGISIHYNMLADFSAFRQAIDTVGGVQINVPEQLYDPTMAWENNGNPVLAKAGVQQFDGAHALLYVRSRETSTDFARSERQRAVIVALKDKVMTLGTLSSPLKISELISAFGDNVQTDLSISDMTRLVSIVKAVDNQDVKSIGFADKPNNYVVTDHVGNQSVVRPSIGFDNYSDIQKYVRSLLVDGFIAKENAKITVLNGTMTEGLASKKANELKSYGYNVTNVGYAPTADYQNTLVIDLSGGQDKYTRHYLEERYGVTAQNSLPKDSTIQTGQADFIIVLGKDETFSSKD